MSALRTPVVVTETLLECPSLSVQNLASYKGLRPYYVIKCLWSSVQNFRGIAGAPTRPIRTCLWDILLISIPQSQDQKFWGKLIYWNKNYQEQVLTTYLAWINSCSSLIHWFWRIFWSCDRHKTRNSLVSWLWY